MAENVKELSGENFDSFVSEGNVVVDMWAEWCGPCRILSPTIDQLSGEMKSVKFGKVDVDGNQDIAERFEVMSIPTILFFKDGDLVYKTVGAHPKADLKKLIEDTF